MSVSKSRNLEIWIVLNSKKNTQLNCIFALSMTNKHSFLWQNPFKKECFVVDHFKSKGGGGGGGHWPEKRSHLFCGNARKHATCGRVSDASQHLFKRVCPSVRISVCLSIHPSVCLSVCPSITVSVKPPKSAKKKDVRQKKHCGHILIQLFARLRLFHRGLLPQA